MIQEPTSRFPSGLPLLGKMDAVVTQLCQERMYVSRRNTLYIQGDLIYPYSKTINQYVPMTSLTNASLLLEANSV